MAIDNTRTRLRGGRESYFDLVSQETVDARYPVFYIEEFFGAGKVSIPAAGSPSSAFDWVKKIVGAAPPTVAGVANAAGGQTACTLTSTSEKQDAALYHNDQLNFDVTKGLIWEARIALSVLPSAAGVQAVWGLSSAWIDGPDNASYYLEFGATASGAVLLRSQDQVTQNSIASGVTKTAGAFSVYRIEATDVTDIRFYIDGVQVSSNNAVAFAATGANAIVQPYLSAYKPSGVGVATLTVDYVKILNGR